MKISNSNITSENKVFQKLFYSSIILPKDGYQADANLPSDIQLSYYVTKQKNNLYGVLVEKCIKQNQQFIFQEEEMVTSLTFSQKEIHRIVATLHQQTVVPSDLMNILDTSFDIDLGTSPTRKRRTKVVVLNSDHNKTINHDTSNYLPSL